MSGIVFLNGRFLPAEMATVSVDDRGLLYGDGLFETMRSDSGHVWWLDRHLHRLYNAAERMRITIPETPELMAAAVCELVMQNGGGNLAIRITVTRGRHHGRTPFREVPGPATRIITARTLPDFGPEFYENGIRVVTVDCPTRDASPSRGLKSLAYLDLLFYKDWADRNDAFEAILIDTNGRVVEGSSSNVFVVKDGAISTPDLSAGLLPGVIRSVVLDVVREMGIPMNERTLALDELLGADEIFITNSVVEVVAVSALVATDREFHFGGTVANQVRSGLLARKQFRENGRG